MSAWERVGDVVDERDRLRERWAAAAAERDRAQAQAWRLWEAVRRHRALKPAATSVDEELWAVLEELDGGA